MMHDDDVNVEIALELMKSTSSPKDFISEIFAIYVVSKNDNLIANAEKILKVYGSAQLKSRLSKVRKDKLQIDFEEWMTNSGINTGHFYRLAYLKDRYLPYFNRAVQLLKADELDKFLDDAKLAFVINLKIR
jgi:hypothetical protein